MRRSGFTIIEVLVALCLFTGGVLLLASGSALAIRMIGRSHAVADVAGVGAARIEALRGLAASGPPGCAALASGSQAHLYGVTEDWQVTGSGPQRTVLVIVGWHRPQGPTRDSLATVIRCALP